MKKLFVLIVFLGLFSPVRSDEGMWLPMLINRLNYTDMQKMGLKLTAEEIWSVNNSSLKDAIVIYGRGCTGEIISPEGLLLTNHHCGYGVIQSHSTTTSDYLKDGFWAMNKGEELPNPNLSVRFLQRMEEVTEQVLDAVKDIKDEAERIREVGKIMNQLGREAVKGTHYEGVVREFFDGNAYYLFIYEVYTDVRLVGAPPSSIGKFGADTDNWMWPRHTGDFSLFRVYAGPDGKPAPYAKENIPLKPRHYLPISLEGVKEGDFSMILGYPGNTDRYLTSWGIDLNLNSTYPTRIDIRRKKLDIMMEDMQADPAVRIKYSSKYAGISNYWKNFIGMSKALKKLKVADTKRDLESRLAAWINADPVRKEMYGNVLKEMEEAYKTMEEFNVVRFYYVEAVRSGSELLSFALDANQWVTYLKSDAVTDERTEHALNRYESMLKSMFKDLNLPTDQKLLAAMLDMYYRNVPVHQQPDLLREIGKKFKGDFAKYAAQVFKKTMFTSPEKTMAALQKKDPKAIEKDPLFQLAVAFEETIEAMKPRLDAVNFSLSKNKRLFMAALTEMENDKVFYPNANFTMRLTYGTVKGYSPADAVEYLYLTTMDGIMEKEDPDNWEFVVPEKLKNLYKAKDFGPYGVDGKMPVAFLTNLDITGGNSGSPVINANGELIGCAFDGNWEAMSGDIQFEAELQRTINVDIRYVLFIIEKYGEAKHLIDEMKIVGRK
ncbi:MAG: S46 family peptidase [Bacteroidales bacterium]